MSQKERRNSLFINRPFQLKFVGYIIFATLISVLIFFAYDQYYYLGLIEEGKKMHLPSDHIYFQLLENQQKDKLLLFSISSGLMTLFLISFSLGLSHRIAGPLKKFENHLKSTSGTKKVPPIEFRKRDFFQEIPEAFNQFCVGHDLMEKSELHDASKSQKKIA